MGQRSRILVGWGNGFKLVVFSSGVIVAGREVVASDEGNKGRADDVGAI